VPVGGLCPHHRCCLLGTVRTAWIGRRSLPARLASGLALGGLCALALAASPVAADGGPHVVGVNSGTTTLAADSCAGCHRAHAAQGPELIAATDETTLCLMCHGASSAGATTDVVDGVLAGTESGLKGGGFSYALMDTDWTGGATSQPVTSAHLVDGVTSATLWGNGAIDSGAGPAITLTCTSCHNPHGTGTYRILRPIPVGSNASVGVSVTDEATPVYTVASAQNRYFGEIYAGGNAAQQDALDEWCATCHTRYDAVGPGAGHTDSGDSIYAYQHTTRYSGFIDCALCHDPVDFSAPSPLGVTGAIAHRPVCENCHVAHGTSASMGIYSGSVAWPDGSTTPSGDARSSLLRLDNRGVCSGCHDPTV
jgi:predicted CXXCH cytochrome family protein